MSDLNTLFESFDDGAQGPSAAQPGPTTSGGLSETDRLAIFEDGYKSGWDDCVAAEVDEIRKVSAELARNLGDLGFTYHEARSQMLDEVETLLGAFFSAVLPRIAGSAVVLRVAEDLLDLAAEAVDAPVEIVVPPSDAETVRGMMRRAPSSLPIRLVEEPALAAGQAYLRFGRVERKYDLSDMADRLLAALSDGAADTQQGDVSGTAG